MKVFLLSSVLGALLFSMLLVPDSAQSQTSREAGIGEIKRLAGVRQADRFPGSDVGEQINNAVADCINSGIVCSIYENDSGTISTAPDLPPGFSIHFNPAGIFTLKTHWNIYHRGTQYFFNGAEFDYAIDDGGVAFYIGKNTTSVVSVRSTRVTWKGGSSFAHIDVGDQIMVDSGSFGPKVCNVAAVNSPTSLTLTSTSCTTNTDEAATFYMEPGSALGSYPGKAPVLHDLNINSFNSSKRNNVALAIELTSGVTVNSFAANNFATGTCLKLLGAITGTYFDIHCNGAKNGLLLDQNSIGRFWISTSNANRFYGVDLDASPSTAGYAFQINGGSGNLIDGLHAEGNAAHKVATIQQITAMGYGSTKIQAGGNRLVILDWERNGDSVRGATDISIRDASSSNIIEGGSFTSTGGTFIGVSAESNTRNTILRDTSFVGYQQSYCFAYGATGSVSNLQSVGTNVAPSRSQGDSAGLIFGSKLVYSALLVTSVKPSDTIEILGVIPNSHCSLTATNKSAAANLATTFISQKARNQITVTHTAIPGMTFDVLCSAN